MIDYINKRLNDWARWKASDARSIRHALGAKNCWPDMLGESESTETVRQHGTLVPLNDVECCETDKAVCALVDELKLVVFEFYCRIGTTETAARRCGVCKATLFNRIDRAHWHIMGSLNDLAAGIRPMVGRGAMPQPATRRTLARKSACVDLD